MLLQLRHRERTGGEIRRELTGNIDRVLIRVPVISGKKVSTMFANTPVIGMRTVQPGRIRVAG